MSCKAVLIDVSTVGKKMRGYVPVPRKKGPRGQTKYEKKITARMRRANKINYRLRKQDKKSQPKKEKRRSFLPDIFGGRA